MAGKNDIASQVNLKEWDSADYKTLRKSLIANKGSSDQIQLLHAARKNSTFIEWVERHITQDTTKAKDLPTLSEKITEDQFRRMPVKLEQTAYSKWGDVTPSVACRPGFWGCVTFNHIKKGLLQSSFLAVTNRPGVSGLTRIETALSKGCDKSIDDVTRTILRRMSGLPEARGGIVTLQVNCMFGRAWWRSRMIEQTVQSTGGDVTAITETLRESQEYWEKLVSLLRQRNSVFGDEKVRSTLVWALSFHLGDPKYKNLFLANGAIDRCTDLLGVYSAIQEFGVFEVKELRDFIEKRIIEPTVDTPSDTPSTDVDEE